MFGIDFDVKAFERRWTDKAIATLRVVTGLLYLEHGTSKILGFPYTSMSGPAPWSLFWVAGMLELFGSLLLIVGLFTRPVAFLLAGEMAIAYWYIHAPLSGYPLTNRGEAAILFCFIFLLFVATGPGAWNIDDRIRRDPDDADGYVAP